MASGFHGDNVDNLTASYTLWLCFTFGTNSMHASLTLTGFLLSFQLSSTNLWWLLMHRTLRPVRVRLRHVHARVIRLSIALWEIRFSTISVGLTCLHPFQKSGFSRTNTINRLPPTSCTRNDCYFGWKGSNSNTCSTRLPVAWWTRRVH